MSFIILDDNHDFFYRCNGTGRPTKAHIKHKDASVSLCGWVGDEFSQEYDSNDWCAHELDVCKKCLNKFKNKQHGN